MTQLGKPSRELAAVIADAERVLPAGEARDDGLDSRWQAIIAVGEFIETEPEAVWLFTARWGAWKDADVRTAVATCLLEHLLEHYFEDFFPRVKQAVRDDVRFADTFSRCGCMGRAALPQNVRRFERLMEESRGV